MGPMTSGVKLPIPMPKIGVDIVGNWPPGREEQRPLRRSLGADCRGRSHHEHCLSAII